jgi:hypothetical protein
MVGLLTLVGAPATSIDDNLIVKAARALPSVRRAEVKQQFEQLPPISICDVRPPMGAGLGGGYLPMRQTNNVCGLTRFGQPQHPTCDALIKIGATSLVLMFLYVPRKTPSLWY